jgi:hypothetical protein
MKEPKGLRILKYSRKSWLEHHVNQVQKTLDACCGANKQCTHEAECYHLFCKYTDMWNRWNLNYKEPKRRAIFNFPPRGKYWGK